MTLATDTAATLRESAGIAFLGVSFDNIELTDVLDKLLSRNPSLPFAPIVTPNVDHLVRISRTDPAVAHAYEKAWLCLNDSRVVEFLARLLKVHLPAVPGSDLLHGLFNAPSFDPTSPILLVGASRETFSIIIERYRLTNATHYDAPMGLLEDNQKFDDTVRFIIEHPARYTILAVGSPQQELIARRVVELGEATGIGLCTGAAAEFLAHPERRAPRWISRAGLEWFFRLSHEPARLWRRYLVNSPRVFPLLMRDLKARRKQSK